MMKLGYSGPGFYTNDTGNFLYSKHKKYDEKTQHNSIVSGYVCGTWVVFVVYG